MKARLVYLLYGQEFELESMDLEALDQLTYSTFSSESEIIASPRYEEKLKNLPKSGEVKVAFSGFDVPLQVIDSCAQFGFDPFKKGSQYMSVLVGDRKIGPTVHSIRENIVRTLCDAEVVEEFYVHFKEMYTPKERFFHHAGMLNENNALVFEGIKRIINDATMQKNGYFAGRMFVDALSGFNTVKNKDEKGRLCSPKVMQKK